MTDKNSIIINLNEKMMHVKFITSVILVQELFAD